VLSAQSVEADFVRLALKKIERTMSFSYNFNVYFKSVGDAEMPKPWQGIAYVSPDTFVCQYTSWGGKACDYYSIRIGDSIIRYFFEPEKKQFEWFKTNKEQFAPNSGFNCYSNLAQMGKPIYYLSDSNCYFLSDTFLNGMHCKRVFCVISTNGVINSTKSVFYINTADSFLVGFEKYAYLGNLDPIYNAVFIKSYEFKKHFDSGVLLKKINSFNDITNDTVLNPPFIPSLSKGDNIMSFDVLGLFDSIPKTKYTNGKVVLLDFWYMACYGCVKSYPTINKLHNQYKNNRKVEIYSVNPFDLDKMQQLKLRSYVQKYKMEGSLVKMENQQFKYFQTNVYPTFYVLVNGVVKAIKIGYYDELYEELNTLIENGLKQIK
jgi:thiol-disulfide isomerase/thioredoxin